MHFIPGVKQSAIPVLHAHVNVAKYGIDKLHLPYQVWPLVQGGRMAHEVLTQPWVE